MIGFVWTCGDECACSEARIRVKPAGEYVWIGTFDSGEGGGFVEMDETKRVMAKQWPEAFRAIEWMD